MKTEEKIEEHYLNILPELTRCELEERYMELYSRIGEKELYAAQKIDEKNEEIRKWIKSSCYKESDVYFIAIDELNKVLSIPQSPNNIRNDIENLRDDIEKHSETLDLISDSDIIQMYGSVIGRLNLILNS